MKKLGAIIMMVALLITFGTSFAFADSLAIEETYPKDDSKGASIENLGVKVRFNNEMSEKTVGKANEGKFQLYDKDGKKIPTRVLYNEDEKGVVLVLLDSNKENRLRAESNSDYTLKISGDVVDDKGNALGKDEEINFRTLNQGTNSLISMGMMVVMIGGMLIISKRSVKKASEEVKKEEKVNPYKEAKKTGKSVEEIVEKDQKKKAKAAAAAAKSKHNAEYEDEADEVNKYRVKSRRPASAAGSKYVAAKKEAAKKASAKGAKNASKKKKKK